MVAYSFKKQFAMPIINGTKRQTVRADRKRHARPGERLQLFTGMRTKHCHKILDVDPVCALVLPILIELDAEGIYTITVNRVVLYPEGRENFARADGFKSLADMHKFWLENHGAKPFKGVIITW